MFKKYLLSLVSLVYTTHMLSELPPFKGISFLNNRPQHMPSGKNLTIWHEHLYQHEQNKTNNILHVALTASYNQSFKNAQIAETLFGSTVLHIAGSAIQERPNNALVADYFGLSPHFESTIFIRPSIKTGIITADFVWSLGNYCKGLYIKTAFPFCISKWSLDLHEIVDPEITTTAFPAGYMNTSTTTTNPFAQSFKQAIKGKSVPGNVQLLAKGKMDHQRKIDLADIPLIVGWQPVQKDSWGLALELIGSIPTGTRPKSNYLFEPIIGNGREPALGVGVVSYIKIWEGLEQYMHLYVTGHLFHFFNGTHYRSFDFKKNGFLSRYLLVKEFDDQQIATGTIVPAINITTLKCHVHHAIVFDGTVLFAYTHNNFFTDLGYNGFIKSKDKIELKETIPLHRYGIKGTQYIFDTLTNTIDNSTASSIAITQGSLTDQISFADPSTVFINTNDLCTDSAQMPLSIIHTFFAAIGYRKQECQTQKLLPFWGIGAEVSLEGLDLDHFSSITKHSISQWSLYLKGGFSY